MEYAEEKIMNRRNLFILGIMAVGVLLIVLFQDTISQRLIWLTNLIQGDVGFRSGF